MKKLAWSLSIVHELSEIRQCLQQSDHFLQNDDYLSHFLRGGGGDTKLTGHYIDNRVVPWWRACKKSQENNHFSWGMDVFTPAGLIKDQRILTCITYNIFQVRLVMQATQRSTSELTWIWIGMCPYSWLKGPVFFLKKHLDFHDQDNSCLCCPLTCLLYRVSQKRRPFFKFKKYFWSTQWNKQV